MAGHSIGGNTASQVMLGDHRVLAGSTVDGTFFAPIPSSEFDRAVPVAGHEHGHIPGGHETSWDRDWPYLAVWKRWFTFGKSDHASFTDLPVPTDQLGMPEPDTLGGARALELTRDYIGAFFEQHLRGCPQPVLDGPAPANPEAHFWS